MCCLCWSLLLYLGRNEAAAFADQRCSPLTVCAAGPSTWSPADGIVPDTSHWTCLRADLQEISKSTCQGHDAWPRRHGTACNGVARPEYADVCASPPHTSAHGYSPGPDLGFSDQRLPVPRDGPHPVRRIYEVRGDDDDERGQIDFTAAHCGLVHWM